MKTKIILLLMISILAISGIAYSKFDNPRISVEFFSGHTHIEGGTQGAPGHSGGTDAYGCHNASVPYHCH
ncbi:hypothetical protein [Solemya velum gill symbiont]|uniref:hypothetical protein n=1 Tax=Solemya velum gill symbiont TaxID=2340 RepID=UPI00117A47B6|nr:hypothetical protein [Solemya velum gill symbiont]